MFIYTMSTIVDMMVPDAFVLFTTTTQVSGLLIAHRQHSHSVRI